MFKRYPPTCFPLTPRFAIDPQSLAIRHCDRSTIGQAANRCLQAHFVIRAWPFRGGKHRCLGVRTRNGNLSRGCDSNGTRSITVQLLSQPQNDFNFRLSLGDRSKPNNGPPLSSASINDGLSLFTQPPRRRSHFQDLRFGADRRFDFAASGRHLSRPHLGAFCASGRRRGDLGVAGSMPED